MKSIVLAGGSGTRLWPLSKKNKPKQFINLGFEEDTLFKKTIRRCLEINTVEDIFIVTNQKYVSLILQELKELNVSIDENNIIIEPEPKGTLPAIYSAVNLIEKRYTNETVVVFPSDHIILNENLLIDTILNSKKLAQENIVTFGITPTYPNTGFGYISFNNESLYNGFLVKEFKEKPDFAQAINYIKKGYLWNSGIFMFNSEVFTNELKKFNLDLFNIFEEGETINQIFSNISQVMSIDIEILEKSKLVSVVPIDLDWDDLGTFDSFYTAFDKYRDMDSNIIAGNSILYNSKGNIVNSIDKKLLVLVDIEDLIVINTDDSLMICKKGSSQKIKEAIELISDEWK